MKKDIETITIECGKTYGKNLKSIIASQALEALGETAEAEIVIDYINSRVDIEDYDNYVKYYARIKKDGTMGTLRKRNFEG